MTRNQLQARILTRFERLVLDWDEARRRASNIDVEFRECNSDLLEITESPGSPHEGTLRASISLRMQRAQKAVLKVADDIKSIASRGRALVKDLETTGNRFYSTSSN